MAQTDRRAHHVHFTRLADIANLASPSAAPRTIWFSATNEHIFQIERSLSFPEGRSKEQGGTIVADAQGRLGIQNLGGLGSTAGSFSPNLVSSDPAKFTVVGTLHTHPYDRSEGSVNGVSFSGGDVAHLINHALTISVVQSGPRLFVLLRTARSPPHVDFVKLNDDQNAAIEQISRQGRTFQQASRIEAEKVASIYGLAYYQGSHGVVTRVSPR